VLLLDATKQETTPVRLPPDIYKRVVELTPLVSVDLVLRDPDRRILVGLRMNRPARGYWFVPGGRVGKNETFRQAFRRLTEEELGASLAFERGRFLGVFEHLYDDNFAEEAGYGTHYVVVAYEVPVRCEELALPACDQHSAYLWLTEREIVARSDVHDNTKAYCGL
jgi:colanic acid biosynthesis protein WcaH